ncbi:MAG: GspH/FimT family pseudopilin [Deltaproteobacteria bacterium]|nr:GspH/FimT family pseudopilin [Deltaproteobacteria bacterium]
MRRAAKSPPLPRSGFTLPELLAVLAIVGGLWLVGNQALARAPDARLRAVVHDLVLAMRVARTRAITLNHTVYVDFAPAPLRPADGVYTAFADLDGDHAEGPGEREAAQVLLDGFRSGRAVKTLPRGIHFGAPGVAKGPGDSTVFADGVSFSGGADRVAFFPAGNAGAGTVYLSAGDGELVAWAVRTNLSGTIESWSLEDGRWRRRS